MPGLFVVGSVNQDFVVRTERRPRPGETVTGATFGLHPGGKGANQAVAAARLGAEVWLLARVGQDRMGEELLATLAGRGVGTAWARAVPGATTGAAFITVTPDGENAIVVAPGANLLLTPADVDQAAGAVQRAAVLVCQLEVPLEVVERASAVAAAGSTRLVLNLAPARQVPAALLARADPLVVNETEAGFLLGAGVEGVGPARRAAAELLGLGCRSAVVTVGAAGALVAEGATVTGVPAPRVPVVDTTGAGDAFVGALAWRLGRGDGLGRAAAYAARAGAAAVRAVGAQESFASARQVEEL